MKDWFLNQDRISFEELREMVHLAHMSVTASITSLGFSSETTP